MKRIVAIVGRPNVGKSTLFNRLVEQRQAIVDDVSGVTRDRNYGEVEWNGEIFTVIDTGGYVPESDDVFETAIREQVHIALDEADLILFVVDVMSGVTPLDTSFAHMVRRLPHKTLLVANKVDNAARRNEMYDFYALGLGEMYPVSAINGSGTGELLDALVEKLPEEKKSEEDEEIPRFAIVGRPNVGKSSLVNSLLGINAHIVTPIAGTTRDSVNSRYTAFGQDIILIDTAGLRKKAKVKENIEFYSTLRTIRAIEECDVAILMIEATAGIESQDMSIFSTIIKNQKGVVILVNKWDLMEKETNTARDFEKKIREKLAPFDDVPIVFTSAVTKQRLLKGLEKAKEVYQNKQRKIATSELNETVLEAVAQHHPPAVAGRFIRIKYVTQVPASIPTFLLFTNHPKLIPESYKRYLENKMRKAYEFTGVPINVFFRKK
ncbi:MAG: ribosome biogenesis GTPase Der [Bacteroidota bacterium]